MTSRLKTGGKGQTVADDLVLGLDHVRELQPEFDGFT